MYYKNTHERPRHAALLPGAAVGIPVRRAPASAIIALLLGRRSAFTVDGCVVRSLSVGPSHSLSRRSGTAERCRTWTTHRVCLECKFSKLHYVFCHFMDDTHKHTHTRTGMRRKQTKSPCCSLRLC